MDDRITQEFLRAQFCQEDSKSKDKHFKETTHSLWGLSKLGESTHS